MPCNARVVPSTTSHKHEALVPTLDLFARLGFDEIDLNLNHIVERGADPDEIRRALDANRQTVRIASGGWCDFFDEPPAIERTFASVDRQVALARGFGVRVLRLFFGRLPYERYSTAPLQRIVANIGRFTRAHPDVLFIFENHDGASSHPDVCRAIMEGVNQANVRLTFDPINFEHRGVRTMEALGVLRPWIGHVHLKGYLRGAFCGFGEGDVDLTAMIETLLRSGYRGSFTVEYEGIGDRTLRLYQSVERARAVVSSLGLGQPR